MDRLRIFLLLTLVTSVSAQIPPPELSRTMDAFKGAHSVNYLYKSSDIPKSVIEAIKQLLPNKEFKMADSGQKWNATDVVEDANLPFRRLIWVAAVNDCWVIYYELGGSGHSTHYFVISAEESGHKRRALWVAASFKTTTDLKAFVAQAESGSLISDPRIGR